MKQTKTTQQQGNKSRVSVLSNERSPSRSLLEFSLARKPSPPPTAKSNQPTTRQQNSCLCSVERTKPQPIAVTVLVFSLARKPSSPPTARALFSPQLSEPPSLKTNPISATANAPLESRCPVAKAVKDCSCYFSCVTGLPDVWQKEKKDPPKKKYKKKEKMVKPFERFRSQG